MNWWNGFNIIYDKFLILPDVQYKIWKRYIFLNLPLSLFFIIQTVKSSELLWNAMLQTQEKMDPIAACTTSRVGS